ncbi:MAG: sulfite exporter TauE/SafE family protein [Proteobacteria bacterium]|nr:sulfite exporter TauE/SafE family protein [Pseudomonadota bacterium]
MLAIALTFIPLSFFIGLAASAIGFTAWSLIVPVLFVFFGFDLYLSLFISLLVDSANALVLTIMAAAKRSIDNRVGFIIIVFSSLFVVLGIYLGTGFIPQHSGHFKGSIGYFNLVFGYIFIRRGYKKGKLEAARPSEIVDAGKPPSSVKTRLMYPLVAFVGIQTGMVGVGGGMMYSLILISCLSFSTLKATGTAMMVTSVTALLAAVGIYLQVPDIENLDSTTFILVSLIVGMSILGTLIGTRVTYSLSERNLNYLIGVVVIAASVFAIIQGALLQ